MNKAQVLLSRFRGVTWSKKTRKAIDALEALNKKINDLEALGLPADTSIDDLEREAGKVAAGKVELEKLRLMVQPMEAAVAPLILHDIRDHISAEEKKHMAAAIKAGEARRAADRLADNAKRAQMVATEKAAIASSQSFAISALKLELQKIESGGPLPVRSEMVQRALVNTRHPVHAGAAR
ncbi:MAG: hypothetical protein KBA61_03440 [Spirochaetes bacterium]|nr:hypothetical protein [Spirochaetota bacterium]